VTKCAIVEAMLGENVKKLINKWHNLQYCRWCWPKMSRNCL